MRYLLYMVLFALMMNGCTSYIFEPENTAPQTEHDMLVKKQQQALAQQQEMLLDNYRY